MDSDTHVEKMNPKKRAIDSLLGHFPKRKMLSAFFLPSLLFLVPIHHNLEIPHTGHDSLFSYSACDITGKKAG